MVTSAARVTADELSDDDADVDQLGANALGPLFDGAVLGKFRRLVVSRVVHVGALPKDQKSNNSGWFVVGQSNPF